MLRWKKRPRKDGETYVVLEGDLTETGALDELTLDAPVAVFNLARLRYVNSIGAAELVRFAEAYDTELIVELCSPAVVELLNLIPLLCDQVRVESVIVPMECPDCDGEGDVRVHLPPDGARPAIPDTECECGAWLEPGVNPDRYFAFLRPSGG